MGMFDLILSIIVLAAIALLIGALVLWRKGLNRQALLMVILAVVMAVNVSIWLVPTKDGRTPAEQAQEAQAREQAREEAGRN